MITVTIIWIHTILDTRVSVGVDVQKYITSADDEMLAK